MDTPDKDQITVAAPSKFEGSPVFNYISSLSPIEQIKSMRPAHSFNSVTFTSPSSLFASPKISSRFSLSSNQSPDIFNPELSSRGRENKSSKGNSDAVQLFGGSTALLGCGTPGRSARESISKLLDETLELAINLPKTMKDDSGSSASDKVTCDMKEKSREPEVAGASSSLIQLNEENLGEANHIESKTNLRKICRIEQTEEVAGCDWVSLISDAVLNSNTSIVENNSEDQDEKMVDTGAISFISTVLHLPQDQTTDLVNSESSSPSCCCKQRGDPITQPEEMDLKDIEQTPEILSNTLLCKLVVSDPREKMDNEEENCSQSSCQQHNARRRCLDFEMVGGHEKKVACEPNVRSSIPSETDYKDTCADKHLVPSNTKSSGSSFIVGGVGLHLNALTTSSKDGQVVKCKTLASGRKLIRMRSCVSSSLSLPSCPNLNNCEDRDSVQCGNESKMVENFTEPYVTANCEEVSNSSPKRKRYKPEDNGEGSACKRCNCKRSKCLKLYCECFAAGLYCIEPCSCLDCFNKPIHEDKVLETRRQIESRNPLAFAPKVIRSSDFSVESGNETNKTPASARHKKGCNCKKSGCLKRYCECFQGGVGCSINCRCEGCQNSFGTKDVPNFAFFSPLRTEETQVEAEESETCGKDESDANIYHNTVKEHEEEHPDLLPPSPKNSRSKCSVYSLLEADQVRKLSSSLKTSNLFNQPKFEEHFEPTAEEKTPKILRNSFSPSSSLIPASPNSKRVSPPHHEIGSSMFRYRGRRPTLRNALSFPSTTQPREK